mmetsp:Transcript_28860/g.85243  ORF Transcript_28860/g.85243 Transcript_28860/m.85243 type:complete len:113 (-) Transcript_28860:7395-7733(-)
MMTTGISMHYFALAGKYPHIVSHQSAEPLAAFALDAMCAVAAVGLKVLLSLRSALGAPLLPTVFEIESKPTAVIYFGFELGTECPQLLCEHLDWYNYSSVLSCSEVQDFASL